ncbi:unnamed protein product [Acanthoscelides obtectus]|uniref:Uncharacterized protein n=1 Tax=Acanthoscelides obtectus TaxID=200917 RepID=A0A9P0P3M3_ACAOB|nr:unnamed protein product [Acanthoscelides obtectus]CAK1658707.1 hypothetical protein AOBTE_LOCUS21078 [Acanthoscelides obtectus]
MAASKTEKKAPDQASYDLMWKMHIKAEEKAPKMWQEHWGWILDEYRKLGGQLNDKTIKSEYLRKVNKKRTDTEDSRRLSLVIPRTYNGWYGWLAKDTQFSYSKFGPDIFQPMHLPPLYRLVKET